MADQTPDLMAALRASLERSQNPPAAAQDAPQEPPAAPSVGTDTPEAHSGAGLILGRALRDARRRVWLTAGDPGRWRLGVAQGSWTVEAIEEDAGGPVREVLLVPVEAGPVLEAALEWRAADMAATDAVRDHGSGTPEAVAAERAFETAESRLSATIQDALAAAVDAATSRQTIQDALAAAVDAATSRQPDPGEAPLAGWERDLLGLGESEPAAEPDPEPAGDGPGWDRPGIEAAEDVLRHGGKAPGLADQIRALLAERDRLAEVVAGVRQLADNQQSWIDAGRVEQAISREAVRDTLRRILAGVDTHVMSTVERELTEVTAELEKERARWGHYKRLYLSGLDIAHQLRTELAEVTAERDGLREKVEGRTRQLDRTAAELADARAEVAHLRRQDVIGLLRRERDQARAERDELQQLFELQWRRTQEATALWRAEAPDERELIQPDLGALLRYLIDRAETAMAERDRLRLDLTVAQSALAQVAVPTDEAHEAEHRRMEQRFRQDEGAERAHQRDLAGDAERREALIAQHRRHLASCVWIDPGRMSGQPCLGGTRILASTVAGLAADGMTGDQIRGVYPDVTDGGIVAAQHFDRLRRDTAADTLEHAVYHGRLCDDDKRNLGALAAGVRSGLREIPTRQDGDDDEAL